MTWGAIGAAAVGTVGGALLSKNGGSQTVNKDPWGPAQDAMKRSLSRGQMLEDYYQANPFNYLQQAAYGNLFGTLDAANQSLPGLLNFANQQMGQRYQRQSGGAPGSYGGYTSGTPGTSARGSSAGFVPAGLLSSGTGPFVAPQTTPYLQQQPAQYGGNGLGALIAGSVGNAFGTPTGGINWNGLNPWTSPSVVAAIAKQAEEDKKKPAQDLYPGTDMTFDQYAQWMSGGGTGGGGA